MSIATELTALATNTQGILDGKADVAQAITSKGVPTADDASFDTLAINIGLITGGGGGVPLPPGITKQDSGSFTVGAETLCSGYSINHALGEAPKGFIIWSDDVSAYEPSSNYAMKYFCIIAEAYNTGASAKSFANGALVYRASTGKAAVLSNDAATADIASAWANSNTIALVRATIYYKANATYKWFAWA